MKPSSGTPIVFADANVLYSRVLRDYLLYAADEELIGITWSAEVLQEATRWLMRNRPNFTAESARRLIEAMNNAFPYAQFAPGDRHIKRVASLELPDGGDRHVVAAALASGASILCTANIRDFPLAAMNTVGLLRMSPDEMLNFLIDSAATATLRVHRLSVDRLAGATDDTTLAALRTAGAHTAAARMSALLESGPASS